MRENQVNKSEERAVERWNAAHDIGTPVRFWTGPREGEGRFSYTETHAQLLGGHTAVVWLKDVSGCVALSHVDPC